MRTGFSHSASFKIVIVRHDAWVHLKKVDDRTPVQRLQLIPAGQEHILEQEDGKKCWGQVVSELSQALALCFATDEATTIRDGVSFF